MSSAASKTRFLGVWPSLKAELLTYLDVEKMPKDARDWFEKVSFYYHSSSFAQRLTNASIQLL
jgi:hypothetical protein